VFLRQEVADQVTALQTSRRVELWCSSSRRVPHPNPLPRGERGKHGRPWGFPRPPPKPPLSASRPPPQSPDGPGRESLVETRWLQPFAQSLLQLRRQQAELGGSELLRETLEDPQQGPRATEQVRAAQLQAASPRSLPIAITSSRPLPVIRPTCPIGFYHEVVASRMRPLPTVKVSPGWCGTLARTLARSDEIRVLGPYTPVTGYPGEAGGAHESHAAHAMDHGIELPASDWPRASRRRRPSGWRPGTGRACWRSASWMTAAGRPGSIAAEDSGRKRLPARRWWQA